jgi:hypothetical protein
MGVIKSIFRGNGVLCSSAMNDEQRGCAVKSTASDCLQYNKLKENPGRAVTLTAGRCFSPYVQLDPSVAHLAPYHRSIYYQVIHQKHRTLKPICSLVVVHRDPLQFAQEFAFRLTEDHRRKLYLSHSNGYDLSPSVFQSQTNRENRVPISG